MIGKLASVAFFSSVLLGVLNTATAFAVDRSACQQSLSATDRPVFAGLKAEKFDIEPGSSLEGGEYQVFSNSEGIPVYVLVTQYGETGKVVALYKLLNGSIHSYSAKISNYHYQEPIYSGSTKVAQVDTSSFVVCSDSVVKGIGAKGVPQDLATMKEILIKGIEIFNSRRPKPIP